MAHNIQNHVYPTSDDIGDVMSPSFAAQLENLYNLANHLLLNVDGDQIKPSAPN
jgi:hypothetical protein